MQKSQGTTLKTTCARMRLSEGDDVRAHKLDDISDLNRVSVRMSYYVITLGAHARAITTFPCIFVCSGLLGVSYTILFLLT